MVAYATPLQGGVFSDAPAAPLDSPHLRLPTDPAVRGNEGDDDDEPQDAAEIPRSGVARGGQRPEPPAAETPAVSIPANQNIADTAMQYLGAPYAWAGNSPRGFDCSGFVQYVYRLNGVELPRDISGMIAQGEEVARDSLQPGDVIVFINTFERGLSHVGLYLNDGDFIHSVNEWRGVGIDTIDGGFWGAHYYSAIRFQ